MIRCKCSPALVPWWLASSVDHFPLRASAPYAFLAGPPRRPVLPCSCLCTRNSPSKMPFSAGGASIHPRPFTGTWCRTARADITEQWLEGYSSAVQNTWRWSQGMRLWAELPGHRAPNTDVVCGLLQVPRQCTSPRLASCRHGASGSLLRTLDSLDNCMQWRITSDRTPLSLARARVETMPKGAGQVEQRLIPHPHATAGWWSPPISLGPLLFVPLSCWARGRDQAWSLFPSGSFQSHSSHEA